MNRVASRAYIAVLLALLLVAGMGFFVAEYVTQAEQWVMFPGSPHIYSGGNIGCGTVVDAQGELLLDMRSGRDYSDSESLRKSTVHWIGDRSGSVSAPAVPYHSGDLAGYDLLNGVYTRSEETGVAKLTLLGDAQKAALEAMGDKKGTVAVYNYQSGQILCAVTTPTFDPDNVPNIEGDETGRYEGLYLNRFTQAAYVPGSIFKIVTLAAALEEYPDALDMTFSCDGTLTLDHNDITCENAHGTQTLKEAFRNSCNCAFAELAVKLGAKTMEKYVRDFGITEPVCFDGIETIAGKYEAVGQGDIALGWSGVGQFHDQVNPCAFLEFVGAVAGGGKAAQPYLVENVMVGNRRTYTAKTQMGDSVLSQQTANLVAECMRNNVENKYGDDYFPGLTVCAKTGTAEVGGGRKPNAMLAGFAADSQYPLAFIVCVEDGGYGAQVCLPIASQVLKACVSALNTN